MNRIFMRTTLALAGAAYLFVNFIPHPHAEAHDGIDHVGATALSGTLNVGALEISEAFSRATLPNAPVAGGFLTIANTGETDDRLVRAEAEAAAEVQLHEMALVDDVMVMREVEDGIALPAGETVTLAPGGLHVMFMGLGQPFIEGECVEVTLHFAVAGEAGFCMPVGPADARGAGHGDGHGHGEAPSPAH